MTKSLTNIDAVAASLHDLWSPRTIADVNDYAVKLAKIQGSYVWHTHAGTDELFLVVDGAVDINVRDDAGVESAVHLEQHDIYVVPRGVEHCPVSEGGATVLLIEPAGTLSTGDYAGVVPAHITSTTGIRAD